MITLGIIGIVAALTIPTLMQKTQERESISKLKKVYSVLQNAYSRAINDEGEISDWGTISDDDAGSDLVMQKFVSYLNVLKNCGTDKSGCFYSGKYKILNGTVVAANDYSDLDTSFSRVLLSDGTSISFDAYAQNLHYTADSAIVGMFIVDINGQKKPNQWGVDTFDFSLLANGKLLPSGASVDTIRPFETYCDKDSSEYRNGRGCTAWVLYNENMDYLHCTGLSWTGKTKCD